MLEAAVTTPKQPNSGSVPSRIVLMGFMGAGKSTVGVRLARELDWGFVDLDEEIVRAAQMSIAAIFESTGEAKFRELEHLALTKALKRSEIVLALGGGAIETAGNRKLLAKDTENLLIYLQARLDVLLRRCEGQNGLFQEKPRRPVFEQSSELKGRFLRRQPWYESADWTIQTAESTPDEIVRTILTRWKEQTMGQPS